MISYSQVCNLMALKQQMMKYIIGNHAKDKTNKNTHTLVTQRGQNDGSLDGVQHDLPKLFENTFQHCLLTNLGK